jgi:hypothetical protein
MRGCLSKSMLRHDEVVAEQTLELRLVKKSMTAVGGDPE